MNAAVRTVCVSFASNPLYSPCTPLCLKMIFKITNYFIETLHIYGVGAVHAKMHVLSSVHVLSYSQYLQSFKTIYKVLFQRKLSSYELKGELQPEISLLHMKVLTLIKAKSNVFDTCNAVAAREDRKPTY